MPNKGAKKIEDEPVSRVAWVHRSKLIPNDYNPNRVMKPELELLIISILESGWTQPIVILDDFTIVDGFHRYTVSGDKRLMARYDGMVPTVQIVADPVHRKMATVRHNRARGTHGVLPMSKIVKGMVEDGVPRGDIARRLGMENEEIERLLMRLGMPTQAGHSFGKAWVPTFEKK